MVSCELRSRQREHFTQSERYRTGDRDKAMANRQTVEQTGIEEKRRIEMQARLSLIQRLKDSKKEEEIELISRKCARKINNARALCSYGRFWQMCVQHLSSARDAIQSPKY